MTDKEFGFSMCQGNMFRRQFDTGVYRLEGEGLSRISSARILDCFGSIFIW